MRTLLFALVFSLSYLASAQNVLTNFEQVVLSEDFQSTQSNFPQKYNAKELFMLSEQAYLIKRLDPLDFSVSYARLDNELSSFHMKAVVELSRSKENAGGIIVHGQNAGNGGIVLEINSKKRFRVRKLLNGQEKYLTVSKKEGWIKSKLLKKKGSNVLEIKAAKGYYDLYLNGQYVYTVFDLQFTQGSCGLFVQGGTEMVVKEVTVMTEGPRIIPQFEDSSTDSSVTFDPSFEEVILLFKTKIDQQQVEIKNLEFELDKCKSMLNYDTTLVMRSTDLEAENERLLYMLDSTTRALSIASRRLEFLESFREDVEAGSNGDLVLNLSTILAEIKKENATLKEENNQLKTDNQELENGNDILLREVDRLRKLLELQNE